MRASRSLLALASCFLCLTVPLKGTTQEIPPQADASRESLLEAARAIMDAARYCALVTLDQAGTPQVRTMDPFPPGDDMSVWMGTNRNSRKVGQIQQDGRVTLHYAAPDASGYVMLTGRARIVDDPSELAARWKPEWEPFYQDRESEYILIEVVPERLEVVDYRRGIVGDPGSWEPPSVVFR